MPDYNLMFKCSHCGWWAAGRHHAEGALSFEDLDFAIFDVTCTCEDCGWSEQLPGSEGHKKPTSSATCPEKPESEP